MTEFFKDKFNTFYADRQKLLKQTNFQQWQQHVKSGGLTATSKSDMDVMMRDFIVHIFGKDLLEGRHPSTEEELSEVER